MDDRPHPDAPTLAEPPAAPPLPVGAAESDATAGTIDDGTEAVVGTQIGRYKLLQKIGEGGWGVVYMAEQQEPVRRRLALKIIKLGMDTKNVIARFEAERQALAMMDHPNIARVLDAGATDTGRPFFVMELVRGISVTAYCDQHSLTMQDRLHLFLQICQAVQHAHQKGIIHRDLKPSNILVSHQDGRPLPKVIDFGIAKASEVRLTDKTLFTAFEQFIGTPAYMSPEQAEMNSLDIDTRSDIYSLGVLLYELLTGRTPFASGELAQAGLEGMRRIIRECEPSRPSTRLSELSVPDVTSAAKRRQVEPARLASLVRGDLDWIVMKAIDKDRTRRYATAHEFGADVDRFLKGEPVLARPPSRWYRLQKLVRRHRVAVGAGMATVTALAAGLAVAVWQYREKKNAWQITLAAEAEKGRLLIEARKSQASEAALRAEAERQERTARDRAYAADINLAQQALAANNLGRAQELLAAHQPAAGQRDDPRGWEWRYLWQLCQGEALLTLCHEPEGVRGLTVSGDGRWVALEIGRGPEIALWDMQARRETERLNARPENASRSAENRPSGVTPRSEPPRSEPPRSEPPRSEPPPSEAPSTDSPRIVRESTPRGAGAGGGGRRRPFSFWDNRVAFAPTGDMLAYGRSERKGSAEETHVIHVRQAANDAVLKEIPLDEPPVGIWFSGDGRRLAVLTADNRLRHIEWTHSHVEVPEGTLLSADRWVPFLRPSPDLQLVAMVEAGGRVRVVDATTGLERWPAAETGDRWLRALTFSPDGSMLAAGSGLGSEAVVRLWDTQTGQEIGRLEGHRGQISSLVFWPDGRTLASASDDQTIRLWDVQARRPLATLRGHRSGVRSVALLPNGATLLSAGANGAVLGWDTEPMRRERSQFTLPGEVVAWQFTPDSRSVITLNAQGRISRWHGRHFEAEEVMVESGIALPALTDPARSNPRFSLPRFSIDGRLLALGDADDNVAVWDVSARSHRSQIVTGSRRTSILGFIPSTTDLLTEHSGLSSSRPRPNSPSPNTPIPDPPDGPDDRLTRWDTTTGMPRASWPLPREHGPRPRPLAGLSPDGRWLVTSNDTGFTTWRDLGTGDTTALDLNLPETQQISFSPDSRYLVAISRTGTGGLWDAATRQKLADFRGFLLGMFSAAFSPDARRLAISSSGEEALKLFDLASHRELLTLDATGGIYHTTAFSPDGNMLAASNAQGVLTVWRAPPPNTLDDAPPAR